MLSPHLTTLFLLGSHKAMNLQAHFLFSQLAQSNFIFPSCWMNQLSRECHKNEQKCSITEGSAALQRPEERLPGERMLIPDPALGARIVKILTTARGRSGAVCGHLCTVLLLGVTEDTQAKLLVQRQDAWKNLASIFFLSFSSVTSVQKRCISKSKLGWGLFIFR